MIPINTFNVDILTKTLDSKSTKGKSNATLYPLYASSLTNFTDTTRDFSTYEMAHWINNNDRWIRNRSL